MAERILIRTFAKTNVRNSTSATYYQHEKELSVYPMLRKTKELKASIGKTHARYGNGQYFTDIESQSFTIGQVSRRLYGVPWVRNKLQYFIKIDVTGLNIVQNIPHNFLLPGNNSLNLQNRIIDSGITIFKIKF